MCNKLNSNLFVFKIKSYRNKVCFLLHFIELSGKKKKIKKISLNQEFHHFEHSTPPHPGLQEKKKLKERENKTGI